MNVFRSGLFAHSMRISVDRIPVLYKMQVLDYTRPNGSVFSYYKPLLDGTCKFSPLLGPRAPLSLQSIYWCYEIRPSDNTCGLDALVRCSNVKIVNVPRRSLRVTI